jgi:hypothetical protein
MIFALARTPSGNPKTDAHISVHEQARSRIIEGELSAGLLESVSNPGSKPGVQIGPTFSGFDIFAIALRGIANQPIDIPQTAEMLPVGCHAGKADGVVDDRRAEPPPFH